MSDNQDTPDVEEIKTRLKGEEVKIEDETIRIEEDDLKDAGQNVVEEMGDLGRKFAETLRNAWDSEERNKFENELKAGVRQFADEVDKIIQDVRTGGVGTKFQENTSKVRQEVKADDIAERAKSSFTKGLRWLSDEMGKLADQLAAKDSDDLADDIKIVNDSDESTE